MTRTDLSHFLHKTYYKWKAVEYWNEGLIVVKVRGPVSVNQLGLMHAIIPYGVIVHFYTMGFWESLFSASGSWKTK